VKKSNKINGMTTQELADQEGVARITVIKWCKTHKIKRKMSVNGIMEYDLSDKDIQKFIDRDTKRGPKTAKKPKK